MLFVFLLLIFFVALFLINHKYILHSSNDAQNAHRLFLLSLAGAVLFYSISGNPNYLFIFVLYGSYFFIYKSIKRIIGMSFLANKPEASKIHEATTVIVNLGVSLLLAQGIVLMFE